MTDRKLTPAEQELIDHLEMVRRVRLQHGRVPGYHYIGAEDFVLQHGVWFTPEPLPNGIARGVVKQCYSNSIILAKVLGLRYFEGFAHSVIPVLHAWNADEQGRLIDSTWSDLGTAYLGVEFPTPLAFETVRRSSSMLDDWQERYELFREPWKLL